jgi:hypothetical protein
MKVYLPFPFEVFEVEHHTLPTSLISNLDLLHLGRILELVLSQFPHKCVISTFSPPKIASSNPSSYVTMLLIEIL